MRKLTAALSGLVLALGAALLTAVVTPTPVSADAGPTAVPRLHREGRFLVDNEGRLVIVHGLNFVWKKAPYAPPDSPEGFTAADAQWLYDHGFNGARLGVLWSGVTPNAPGVADPSYFAKWDRVVNLMADRGIWMQFDQHQDMWHETYGGEGAPNWAMKRPLPYSLLPYPGAPFPFGYWTPEVSTVFDNFWANKGGVLDGWVAYWKLMAEHYRNQPYSMGYDLINEPWVGIEWPSCVLGCAASYYNELQPAMNKALASIRTVDPSSIVWYEPQQLSSGLLLQTYLKSVPGEQNLGLSWHNYCSATFLESTGVPLNATSSCTSFSRNRENHALDQAARMDAVPLLSEFGATDNVQAVGIDTSVADDFQMSWLYWAYKGWGDPTTADNTGQGLFTDDADLSTVKQAKLRELVRTYPQATAGRDLSYHYDSATGEFTMRFTADPTITAPTRIFVSPLTAPHGYDVVASTGTVVKDGSYVELSTDTAGPVQITINPRP